MVEIQADFYNHLSEEMIDNRYDRFMIRCEEERRRTIVDSNDDYADDKNPLFGRINGSPRCGIALNDAPLRTGRRRGMGQ